MNKLLKKQRKCKLILLQLLYSLKFNNDYSNNYNFLIKSYNKKKLDIFFLKSFFIFLKKKNIIKEIINNSINNIYKISLIDFIIIELNAYIIFISKFNKDNFIFLDSFYLIKRFSCKNSYNIIKKNINKLLFSYLILIIISK